MLTVPGISQMPEPNDQTNSLILLVRILALVAMVVGSLVLAGWLTGSDFLANPLPTDPPLKFNNGLCFLLSGLSVILLTLPQNTGSWKKAVSTGSAVIVLAIGLVTSLEHSLHVNLGIDQLAVKDALETLPNYAPGRMSLNAALYLCLIGLSLLLVDRSSRFCRATQQWLAALVWLLATAAVIGYGYGFSELYNYSASNPLTFPSAVAIYCLSMATFLIRPTEGLAAIYSSSTIAGTLARNLGLVGMLLPGLALINGLKVNNSSDLFVVALLLFLGFPLAVWAAARKLEKAERERLAAEQLIRELNGALAARVEELLQTNAELQLTRDAALEAAKVKSEFLGKISHELRTPVAGILGMIQLVQIDDLSKDDREIVGLAEKSALQLLDIVTKLLDFSALNSGKVRLAENELNIVNVLSSVTSAIEPAASKKGLSVSEESDPRLPLLKGDEDKLRQILLQLATNAVKFTNQGGVSIRVSTVDNANDLLYLKFSVSDTGIGILPEDRKKLFVPFSQADNSDTRLYGGTGLGLVITRDLVELMGGELGFSSIAEKGSTFWCTIPFELHDSRHTVSRGAQDAVGAISK